MQAEAGKAEVFFERGGDATLLVRLAGRWHLQRDLPQLVNDASALHGRRVSITVTPPLDGHPALVSALLDRAQTALAGGPPVSAAG